MLQVVQLIRRLALVLKHLGDCRAVLALQAVEAVQPVLYMRELSGVILHAVTVAPDGERRFLHVHQRLTERLQIGAERGIVAHEALHRPLRLPQQVERGVGGAVKSLIRGLRERG